MTVLHILSQVPAHTGSATFLRMLVREAAHRGVDQHAIYGVSVHDQDAYSVGLPHSHEHPVLFDTAALPFALVGMSDQEPYRSSTFSSLNVEHFSQYRACFSASIHNAIVAATPDVIWSHHLWIASAIVQQLGTA